MDRRLLFAIGLMLIVAVLPSILWPPERPAPGEPGVAGDSAVLSPPPRETVFVPQPAPAGPAGRAAVPPAVLQPAQPIDSVALDTVIVESDLYRLAFSTRGARLVSAELKDYCSFAPGDFGVVTPDCERGVAQLIPRDSRFLAYGFATTRDTLALSDWLFEADRKVVRVSDREVTLQWSAERAGRRVRLTYRFRPGSYLFDVEGQIGGGENGLVTVEIGPRLRSIDADTTADIRAYGVVTKAQGTELLKFGSLDPLERKNLPGPFEWVVIKSRYFVAGVFTIEEGQSRFGGAVAVGGPRSGGLATDVYTQVSLPAPAGRFSHSVYVGPQEFRRLKTIGHDFEDVNPYGWSFVRPIVRPFANFIVRILLWMHEAMNLAYGWVLILFGIGVRVLLWPLNQKAMRSSTAMQAIQPEMKALQDRYKKQDPQRLQQEMMKLYREHGVNPLGGCLPMLIPMPVLFALFFVFANTIEFRGVSFLWLSDLSGPDKYYIVPVIMGASMFALMKLGQRGVPPNPQMKMMAYMMPPLMTFMFLRFAAGLNLYYTVSNIASLPQQWLISNERIRRMGERAKLRSVEVKGQKRKGRKQKG